MKSYSFMHQCQMVITLWFGLIVFSLKADDQTSKIDNEPVKQEKINGTPSLGMSIIGSKEMPTVLYIVPWKSPEPDSEMPLVSRVLDEVFKPLEPEVFERQVGFHYQLINQKTNIKE
ncbi:MAG: hypothetical protein AAGB12_04005 [Pseudomonadota bacterium]